MTVGVWLSEYVIETFRVDDTLNYENSQNFFNTYSKETIPWYDAELLPLKYSTSFVKKFKKAIQFMVRYKSHRITSRFDIDDKTFASIINLCHNYLTYAIGPVLLHHGPPLSSLAWS